MYAEQVNSHHCPAASLADMADLPRTADVVVIGAGIAGAAAADPLARAGLRVAVLERESQAGYHSTGRSAATYIPTYGPPPVWALTAASHALLSDPPGDLVSGPLLRPRAVLHVAIPGQEHMLAEIAGLAASGGTPVVELDTAAVVDLVPALRPEHVAAALLDPGSADMDVAGLHQLHLRRMHAHHATLTTSCAVTALHRTGGSWQVETTAGTVSCAVVVNAAGAWADAVARLAGVPGLGLVPMRRTAFLVSAPPAAGDWPLVSDVGEAWYVKPDAGLLLCSPADQTPVPPGDVRVDELDVARAIDVINERTTLAIRSVVRSWAGLRTFAPDRVPVAGTDPQERSFVWSAGQGGYGIQTAPAMGELVAAAVTGGPAPVSSETVAALSPDRAGLRQARTGI